MSDDYLWDRSGKPDPEVSRLEKVLGKLSYVENKPGDKPQAPISMDSARQRRSRRLTSSTLRRALLLAAAILAGTTWAMWQSTQMGQKAIEAKVRPAAPAMQLAKATWRVEQVDGMPSCGATQLEAGTTGQLRVGQWIETDASSRAKITVADIGEVEVDTETRIKLIATGPAEHRLDLQRGSIHARVEAPPRLFVVNTPAARAVDLGCAYTLKVDERGAATLHVISGWVSLEDHDKTSLVPAGAKCVTRPGRGPGTPWFDDASNALTEALARFDFDGGGEGAIKIVLKEARKRDALSVWHLMSRVDKPLRKSVFEGLRALVPMPSGVTEADVLQLEKDALDQWQKTMAVTW